MNQHKILILISKKEEDREFAGQVASTAGIPMQSFENPKEASEFAGRSNQCVVFADISSDVQFNDFMREFQPLIGNNPNQINPNLVHFISSESLEKMKVLAHSNILGHFVLRNYGNAREAGEYYGRILMHLCREQAFGLENLISPKATLQVMKITHSMDKKRVLDSIREFLANQTSFKERMAEIIITAVDELLMNAIYDAPVDPTGQQQFRKVPRATPIALEGRNTVELQMGFDGEYVAFTVIDRFGTLNKAKLVKHLCTSHEDSAYEVDNLILNAGLGLATTFRTGGSLVFVTEPGVRTEVTTFFRQTPNFREFRNQFRFISIHVG